MPQHIHILGGGPCGLYAAHTALTQGSPVTLYEKEHQLGGLAAGHQLGELDSNDEKGVHRNWFDLGVHMLHAFDQEVFETCRDAMGDERIEVPLKSHIKWGGKTYHYPLRGRDILAGIPPFTLARCLSGLLLAECDARFGNKVQGHDAESALIELYGTPLYEFFFEDFTHRYWGIHPRDLSAEFVRRKMPRLSAVDVFKNLLEKLHLTKKGTKGRNATEGALRFETLHYSATGSETLPRSLGKSIAKKGATIHLNTPVTTLQHDGKRITTLNGTQLPENSQLISTIPLPHLIRALDPPAPPAVLHAADQLRFKPMTVYALLVNKEKCMDALYTYYRDCTFHRVGEPKNAGLLVKPTGHTTLIVETTCEIGDHKWTGDALPTILQDLHRQNLCTPDQVVSHHLIHAPQAYPIFAKGFETHLQTIETYLQTFQNLQSTGRQGAFTYPNMHRAMRMGATAAQALSTKNLPLP